MAPSLMGDRASKREQSRSLVNEIAREGGKTDADIDTGSGVGGAMDASISGGMKDKPGTGKKCRLWEADRLIWKGLIGICKGRWRAKWAKFAP